VFEGGVDAILAALDRPAGRSRDPDPKERRGEGSRRVRVGVGRHRGRRRGVAEGIGAEAQALSTAEATAEALAGAALIVAGSPVLGFKLPADKMRQEALSNPGGSSAAFDTQVRGPFGKAAPAIAEARERAGYAPVAAPTAAS
jgi:hypothetical protein